MTQPLTGAQREVVATDGHLLVSAGAGSGKTTTVVQAICHQLGLDVAVRPGVAPIPPVTARLALDEIAAITFTNAAAADLKRKLRHALRAGGRADLAQEVDAARIGTIHGFCGDMLREHALRARLRPSHRLLSDGEATVLIAESAREALHAAILAEDVPGLPALLEGRRLRDISDWITRAATDRGRLERWATARASLRLHEQALLDVALRAAARHRERLEAEGLVDFDRLLIATRDLLRDVGVRHAAQRRIRLLVIDEFQDVDPVQREIADLLGGLADMSDPAPSRLILVGDPKQSIYRFRRADVTLWNELERRFRDGAGRVLPLSENFRSRAPILGFVDHVIGQLLATPVDERCGRQDFEVDYAPLEPMGDDDAGRDGAALEFQVVPPKHDGKPRNVGEVRALDAAGTARRIRELTASGEFGFGDIALLLTAWGDVDLYERTLRSAGIPVYVQRGDGFWDAREILDCLLALRAIRDGADDVAMVGFLKGPFVGVKDATLLALARARAGRTYRDAIATALAGAALDPREASLLDRGRALLDRFGALRDRLPLAELMRRLLADSGFMAACALEHDGAQRVANLRKLVRLAAESPGSSLGAFLRAAQASRDRAEKVAPEPLYRERGDVVTITSIHRAKGLEWPVVFWCDLVREVPVEKAPFCEGRDRFSIKPGEDDDAEMAGAEGEPAGGDPHAALQARVRQEGIAEAYRLWYVASTRAKRLLVLSGIALGDAKANASPARRFNALLGDLAGRAVVEHARFSATVRELRAEAIDDRREVMAEPRLALPPETVRVASGASRLSASQLMAFESDEARWRRDHVLRLPRQGKAGDAERAVLIGQVTHDILEHLDDGTLDVGALVEEALARWDEDAPSAEVDAGVRLRALLRERVEAARTSPAWREIAGAPGAARELWFTRLFPDGTTIGGALDLVAPTTDGRGARILDVKAGELTGDAAAQRYAMQAAVYVDAVRAISGAEEVSFALLSLRSGDVTPILAPSQSALTDLIRRLRDARAGGVS